MDIRFDTRNTKPKLYHLAGLAAVTFMIVSCLDWFGGEEHLKWMCLLLSVFFASAVFILVDTFFKQLEYNPYSYNTIIYSGFAIFFTYVAVTHFYITFQCFRHEEAFSEHEILFSLLNSAKNYMMLTAPFLYAVSAALFIANISLIRHEGFRFVNLLGIILAVMLVGGEIVLYFAWKILTVPGKSRLAADLVVNLFAAFYLYFECMLTGSVIAEIIAAKYQIEPGRDFLIVLGCGLMPDGTPTPLLKGRADLAKSYYDEQLRQTGEPARFIVSGGQGPDEVQSEAASMKAYLLSQDVPEGSIYLEDRSVDTFENMSFSKQIIDRILPDARTAFFTTNYHVFRAGLKARHVKMRAVGMGAPTKWYFWPNASIREFIGLLTEHKVKQSFVIAGLILSYTVLTFLTYR